MEKTTTHFDGGRRLPRRGAVVVKLAVMLPVLGAFAAVGIDFGHLHSVRSDLQRAADAAALAAASTMGAVDQAHRADAVLAAARNMATRARNPVDGQDVQLDASDIVLGNATFDAPSGRYTWAGPSQTSNNAVEVTLRRTNGSPSGPVPMTFGRIIGMSAVELEATAHAVLIPRDIAVVIDLSGSMNDDSELYHYKQFISDSGATRPGVQINLYDIWRYLPLSKGQNGILNGTNPAAPTNPPSAGNNQPGNGAGSPTTSAGAPAGNAPAATGPSAGPRWGWMTAWGSYMILGSPYTPNNFSDSGIYYIPKGATTTDPDVKLNLAEAGYSNTEAADIRSGANDTTTYINRVKVMLGLAGWKSNLSQPIVPPLDKYPTAGGGNHIVDSGELVQQVPWPFNSGSWDEYINYVSGSPAPPPADNNRMQWTDPNFRYCFGLKTMTNYLLEKQGSHSTCPELAACPERPMSNVKDAIQVLVDFLIQMNSQDHLSLEVFSQAGHHEIDLTVPANPQDLPGLLQTIPATLNLRQAGYYDRLTNIGAGFATAITELTSNRARTNTTKVILLLTDGQPNCDSTGNYVGDGAPAAVSWTQGRANAAKSQGMTVYTIGVGADVNASFLQGLASTANMYYYADSTPDANGVPLYVGQLHDIFQTLGGKRPVRLIR